MTLFLREQIEQREDTLLAPFAARSRSSLGRQLDEPHCSYRTVFQRDRDRIIHSEAFRRLEYKTQVFVNHEGDYYRTRLTHSLEVAQIARGISRTMQLNEDLAEAIALAHDLGHTPFGHRGEAVLDQLMRDYGGFEHNHQSYRVVTKLERRYPEFNGLNLSFEVREGIVKHSGEYDNPNVPSFNSKGYPTLEAQVVDMADQIAYMNHDLDDGLQSGMFGFEQLAQVDLWQHVLEEVKKLYPNISSKYQKYQTVRRLINFLVSDVLQETQRRIAERNITSLDDVRERGGETVRFSNQIATQTKQLMQFLHENFYRHPHVERMAQKTEKILNDLFANYMANPRVLPKSLYNAICAEPEKQARRICDYIAGMTDRYALNEHAKLFEPRERV